MSGFLNINFARTMPREVSAYSRYGNAEGHSAVKGNYGFSAATWGTANRVRFVPLRIVVPCVVTRAWCMNGDAVAGAVSIGVFTLGGTLIVGSTNDTQVNANRKQFFELTDTTLAPNLYYIGAKCDSASATICDDTKAANMVKLLGGLQATGAAGALSGTYTFAVSANAGIPLIGVTLSPRTY